MTDIEIIKAFEVNDQKGIREAYYAWRTPVFQTILIRTGLDEDYLDDAYQEAVIRLQQHILTGRLKTDNLQRSLLAYLKAIGIFTAKEIMRGRRELPESRLPRRTDENDEESFADELAEGDQDLGASNEAAFDPSAYYDEEERERVIRNEIMLMGKPCAPLLLGFYWDMKSMDTLALELHYSNSNSAKTQKARCMKRLTTYVKNKLIEYGYGE